MTGHSGSTPSEVLLVCISSPIGVFLYNELQTIMAMDLHASILMEFCIILIPMVICQTEFLYSYGYQLLAFQLLLAIGLRVRRTCLSEVVDEKNVKSLQQPEKLEFLTVYRSTVSFLTFIAIFAVDFTVFPRTFAKTEVSGYGLMDLGAGSFCVSGGLVSQYARKGSIRDDKVAGVVKILIRCIPLFVMGLIRLLTTKGLEYQEHVSEYGIHWNFFFTLCMVGVFSTLLRQKVMNMTSYWIMMLVAYQYLLSSLGFQEYIENGHRSCQTTYDDRLISATCNFFAGNREGILGSIGYLIMHFAGEDIGRYCLWNDEVKQSTNLRGKRLLRICMLGWLLHWASTSIGIPVSRRSTNASFIFWTISHNLTILLCTWMALDYQSMKDQSSGRSLFHTPPIFAAANRHGLIVFILANLMTGIVNLSINTLQVSHGTALFAIIIYICSVSGVALIIDFVLSKLKTKRKLS